MPQLTVTAACPGDKPAIVLQRSQDFPNLHPRSPNEPGVLRKSSHLPGMNQVPLEWKSHLALHSSCVERNLLRRSKRKLCEDVAGSDAGTTQTADQIERGRCDSGAEVQFGTSRLASAASSGVELW